MPVYNVRKYIGWCLRSLKNQTFRDWECIVVDDGSTDGCSEYLQYWVGNDPRFTIIRQENSGLSAARNVGIAAAKGEYLFFLDSDDWLESYAFSFLMARAEVNTDIGRIVGLDIVHNEKKGTCSLWSITPSGVHGPDSPHLFSGPDCDVGHATACLYVRRNIPCEIVFPKVAIFEDMIFNMGLIFAGVTTFVTDCPVYHYINHEGSLIYSQIGKEEAGQIRAAFEDLANRFHPAPDVYDRCRTFLNNALKGKGQ